jgi:hypothetical protein
MDKLDRAIDKVREVEQLSQQLARQLEVKSKHGIDAHEIQKIVLVPNGRSCFDRRITYSSAVTMKNGDLLFFPDVNIKAELDGKEGRLR